MPASGFSKLVTIVFAALVLLIIGGFWLSWTETKSPSRKSPPPVEGSRTHEEAKEAVASGITLLPEGETVIPASYKQCSVDSDCVFVPDHCGYCTCGAVIYKNFEQEYKNQLESLCVNYSGPYCDVSCRESAAKCSDGVCALD